MCLTLTGELVPADVRKICDNAPTPLAATSQPHVVKPSGFSLPEYIRALPTTRLVMEDTQLDSRMCHTADRERDLKYSARNLWGWEDGSETYIITTISRTKRSY